MKIHPLPAVTLLLNAVILQFVTVGGTLKLSKCNVLTAAARSSVSKNDEEKKIHLIEDLDLLSSGIKREVIPHNPDCEGKRDITTPVDSNGRIAESLLPSDTSVEPINGIGVAAVQGKKKYEILKFPKIVDEEDKTWRGRGKSATLMQQGKGVVRSRLYRPLTSARLGKIILGQKRSEAQNASSTNDKPGLNSGNSTNLNQSARINTTDTAANLSLNTNEKVNENGKVDVKVKDIPESKGSRLVTNVIKNTSHLLTIEENVEDVSNVIGNKRSMNKASFQKLRKLATPRSPVPFPKKITPDDAALSKPTLSIRHTSPSQQEKEASRIETKVSSPTILNATLIGSKAQMKAMENGSGISGTIKNETMANSRSINSQSHQQNTKSENGSGKTVSSGMSKGNNLPGNTANMKQGSNGNTPQQSTLQTATSKNEAPKGGGTLAAAQGNGPTSSGSNSAASTAPAGKPAPPPDPYAEIANGPDSPKLPELKTSGEGVNSPLMKVDPESGTMHPVAPAKSDSSPTSTTPTGGGGSSQTDVGGLLDSLTDKLNSGTGPGVDALPPPPPEAMEPPESHSQGTPQQDVGGLLDTLTDKLNLGGNIATDQPIPTNEAKYLQDQLNQYDQQAIMQAQGFNGDKSIKDVKAGDLQGAPESEAMYSKDVASSNPPGSSSSSISPVASTTKGWGDITSLDSLNAEATREEPSVGDSYTGDIDNYAPPPSPQVSDAIAPASVPAPSFTSSYARQTLDAATADDVNYEQQIAGGAYNGAAFGTPEAAGNFDTAQQDAFDNGYQGQYLRRNTIFRPNTYNFEHRPTALDAYTDYM